MEDWLIDWVTTQEKGKIYQIKDSRYTLRRGRIIIKFALTIESSSSLEVMVIGFTKGDNPALVFCIPFTCWFGEYPGLKINGAIRSDHILNPGKRGWNDIMNLFEFLEITDYQMNQKSGIYNPNPSDSLVTVINDL